MISYISGVVEEIEKDKVVVDNNGIGYGIFASQSTLEQIGIGEQVKIYTYFSVSTVSFLGRNYNYLSC